MEQSDTVRIVQLVVASVFELDVCNGRRYEEEVNLNLVGAIESKLGGRATWDVLRAASEGFDRAYEWRQD